MTSRCPACFSDRRDETGRTEAPRTQSKGITNLTAPQSTKAERELARLNFGVRFKSPETETHPAQNEVSDNEDQDTVAACADQVLLTEANEPSSIKEALSGSNQLHLNILFMYASLVTLPMLVPCIFSPSSPIQCSLISQYFLPAGRRVPGTGTRYCNSAQ